VPRDISVKICGLTTQENVDVACSAGARYVGFVFFPKSPRHLSYQAARALAAKVPRGVTKVGLVVDPSDAELDALLDAVPLDMLQLHGREAPARVAEIKAHTGCAVMKAVGIAEADDVSQLPRYEEVADQILVDAKPPRDGALPGGNGLRFDWRLIAGYRWTLPWMLAGGLTPDNVAAAIAATGARQVDVSSGVEVAPDQKPPDLIRAFLRAVG